MDLKTEQEANSLSKAKRAAAMHALEFIKNGMLVGLGSGSTTAFFIEALGKSAVKGCK